MHCHESCHESEGHSESCCHEEDFGHSLLELADEAWMELLKERIKEKIESSCGGQLDELADLITKTNKCRWEHKMAEKHGCKEYREQLCNLFKKH